MKAMRVSRLAGLLALGFMAIGASATDAEVGAQWKVSSSATTIRLKAQPQITDLETLPSGKKEVILLSKAGVTKVEILCTAMKLVDALLQTSGGGAGKAHFEGCVTLLSSVAAPKCKPHSPGAAEGLIETNALKSLLRLHEPKAGEKVDVLEVTPEVGELFVTLKLGKEIGSECAIGASFCISGKLFVKTGFFGELLEERVEHLFQEGFLSALLFGGNAATLDGSATVALASPHLGLKWSGNAG
jgi:hypothetical protein